MVYVLNMRKQPLMPCSSKKASDLLKAGKAVVQQRTPFTIRLTVATGEAKQPVVVGLDPAFKGVGVCAVANGKEVYAAEVELRTDEVELNSERRMYRRNRRNRLWYRKPRFLNWKKTAGRLPSSIRHKLEAHVKVVTNLTEILPVTKVVVEIAAFDIQKIRNPDIQGAEYQQGEQADFYNVRELSVVP
jgi:hypothetical protein